MFIFLFFVKKLHESFFFNIFYKQDNSSLTFVSFEQPQQPPEPFVSFVIKVLFLSLNLLSFVGPAARHLVCFVCFVVKKIVLIHVHSWFNPVHQTSLYI